MKLEDIDEFIYQCYESNIDIPNDIVILCEDIDSIKGDNTFSNLLNVKYRPNANVDIVLNLVDKNRYELRFGKV